MVLCVSPSSSCPLHVCPPLQQYPPTDITGQLNLSDPSVSTVVWGGGAAAAAARPQRREETRRGRSPGGEDVTRLLGFLRRPSRRFHFTACQRSFRATCLLKKWLKNTVLAPFIFYFLFYLFGSRDYLAVDVCTVPWACTEKKTHPAHIYDLFLLYVTSLTYLTLFWSFFSHGNLLNVRC